MTKKRAPGFVKKLAIFSLAVGVTSVTAQANDLIPANAPITYKMSKPGQLLNTPGLTPESLLMDGYSRLPASPQAATPQFSEPEFSAPQVAERPVMPMERAELPPLPAPSSVPAPQSAPFDLSNIDRGLYKNMKVGRPYTVAGQTYTPKHNPDYDKVGTASWYGDKFHGKPTANGEKFDKNAMTAAHKTLPLNSFVIVTNLETGKSLKLRLNDRGPFIGGRIIDLSEAAARELGYIGDGLGKVRVQYAGPANPNPKAEAYVPLRHPKAPKADKPKHPKPDMEPKAVNPEYKPLRQQAERTDRAPITSAPTYQIPDIMSSPSARPVALPFQGQAQRNVQLPKLAPIPQYGPTPNNDDGVVTLTIKGPIHMATHKQDKQNEPKLIPAVHKTVK